MKNITKCDSMSINNYIIFITYVSIYAIYESTLGVHYYSF